jgi:chorismate dehydratase
VLTCDPDSHTSVALAKVIWQLRFHKRLAVEPLVKGKAVEDHQAVLLIGDKVIREQHPWPYQLDLAGAWAELTLLPFVFAFWVGRPEADLGRAYQVLQEIYEKSRHHLLQIAEEFAGVHGFAKDLARQYLTSNLCYDFGIRQQRGLLRFYEFAAQFHILAQPRALHFFTPTTKKRD